MEVHLNIFYLDHDPRVAATWLVDKHVKRMVRMKLFVYGTLRKGMWNNRLLAGSEYLGSGVIQRAALFNYGGFPFVVVGHANDEVTGDLYEISESTLYRCDGLEGYHGPELGRRNFYDRVRVQCTVGDVVHEDVWVYVNPRSEETERYPQITSGDWIKYWQEDRLTNG